MLVTRLGADSLNISPTCRPASHPSAGQDRSREQPMVSTSSGVRKLGNSWWQLAAAGLPASVTSQPQRGQVVHLHLYLPGPHLQLQHLVVFNHLGQITWPQNLVLNHLTTYQDTTAIWMGGKTFPSGRSRWLLNCYYALPFNVMAHGPASLAFRGPHWLYLFFFVTTCFTRSKSRHL